MELTEFNKRAGFSEEEVEFYQETFNQYDKDGGGELTLKELFPLLAELGKEPKTVIQRDKLTELLAEIDEDGSGEIDFSEFLQLMRRFLDESDAAQLLKEKEIVKRTRFEPEEVAQWRDIFIKDEDGCMDFPEFLLIMRKLLDIDFGGIATRTGPKEPKEKTAADKKKEARAARRQQTNE